MSTNLSPVGWLFAVTPGRYRPLRRRCIERGQVRTTRVFMAATGLGIALIWVAIAKPFPDIPGISLMGLALPAGLGVLLYAVILGSARGPGLRALALLLGSALSFFVGTMVLWGGGIELVAVSVALFILAVTEAIRATMLRKQRGRTVEEGRIG